MPAPDEFLSASIRSHARGDVDAAPRVAINLDMSFCSSFEKYCQATVEWIKWQPV
jgi:hypothetical protein